MCRGGRGCWWGGVGRGVKVAWVRGLRWVGRGVEWVGGWSG